ncbi:hypothetical protein HYU90_00040 [Candidatus Collierbacteria bacterium]|nr:hypothetical protein [Candidatus Collierbacteria bacterium]
MQKQVPVLPKVISTWTLIVWEIAIASWIITVLIGAKGGSAEDFFSGVVLCSFYLALGWAVSMDFGAKWKNALSVPVYAWMVWAPVLLSVSLFIGVTKRLGIDPSILVIPVGGALFFLNTAVIVYRLGVLDLHDTICRCPNCGRKHNGAKFCPRCGAAQSVS